MCRSHVRRSDKYWPRSGGRPLHSTRKHGGSSRQGIVIAFSFRFGIGVIRRNEGIACTCHQRTHKIYIRFFRDVHNSVLINVLWPIWDFTNDIVSYDPWVPPWVPNFTTDFVLHDKLSTTSYTENFTTDLVQIEHHPSVVLHHIWPFTTNLGCPHWSGHQQLAWMKWAS